MKVKIAEIKTIEDTEGKYGPQKRIVFREAMEGGDRTVSGWVPLKSFNSDEWKEGSSLELEISQNGKYWNFKLPTKQDQVKNEVMDALRELYKKLNQLEDQMKEVKSLLTKDSDISFP